MTVFVERYYRKACLMAGGLGQDCQALLDALIRMTVFVEGQIGKA
jgi:hypothetical protein